MQQVIFWQEMALAGAPPMANVLGLGLVGPTIIAFGTDAQKARYLREDPERRGNLVPGILRAECRLRPRRPADRGAPRRRPLHRQRPEGVDQLRLGGATGASWWCAPTRPLPKHKGLTVLLVDMKTPGVEVRPLRQMTGETEFNEVFFRDVRVPVANVVGAREPGLGRRHRHADARARHVRRRPADHLQAQHGPADRAVAHGAAQRPPGRRGSRHPAEARAVLRRGRDHAREPDARVQPHQRHAACPAPRARSRRFSGAS